jgi:hypothetical protein
MACYEDIFTLFIYSTETSYNVTLFIVSTISMQQSPSWEADKPSVS